MSPGQALHHCLGVLVLSAALLLVGCSERGSAPPLLPAAPTADPVLNVADFGAVGDGVTDDRPSIQAALDQAGPTGATIYFPAGTFRLGTASAPLDRILITQANQHLVGAGQGVSRLLVGASFGAYVTVIGAARDSLGTGSWSMRELHIDQNARSGNGLEAARMAQSPKMAVRLGHYSDASRVAISQSTFSDSDSANTLYLYAAQIAVSNSRFLGIGGQRGRAVHDHSTVYTTATTRTGVQQISGNTFSGRRSSPGAATAIETHGGAQVVIDNLISDYLRGFNVTGVADAGTSGVTLSGNTVERVAIGVQLWSQPTSEGPGLVDVRLSDNVLGLDGAAWSIPGVMAPTAGVLFTAANTSPVEGIRIERNRIRYVSANAAAQVRSATAGVACEVTAAGARPKRMVIVDNVISGAPTAINAACLVDGAVVRGNSSAG